jgi:hypothetical protein
MARPLEEANIVGSKRLRAAAAAVSRRGETKEAYLNLGQAWLHLAAEIADNQYSSRAIRKQQSDTAAKNGRTLPLNVANEANGNAATRA